MHNLESVNGMKRFQEDPSESRKKSTAFADWAWLYIDVSSDSTQLCLVTLAQKAAL